MFVSEHDPGIADADLGMVDPAAGIIHSHHPLRAKRHLIKRNRITGVVQDQIGRDTVVALRDGFAMLDLL
ncbi:MAG TPA: hypothetical protein VKG22_00445 [Stellaceae bacterium]|nr:hypothetical protein [Stellaceae bacterium]